MFKNIYSENYSGNKRLKVDCSTLGERSYGFPGYNKFVVVLSIGIKRGDCIFKEYDTWLLVTCFNCEIVWLT